MLQKSRGIVLRAKDYGESNQIIQIYSEQGGKFSLMAKGSKKTRSRLSAVTEPFTEAQLIYFQGSGMATLSQADVIDAHSVIRSDLLSATYAAYWLDLLDQLTEDKESNPTLYQHIRQLFSLLEQKVDPEILTRIWELQMLSSSGYRPTLDRCVRCNKQLFPIYLSFNLGGYLCPVCRHQDPQALPMSEKAARLLTQLSGLDLSRLGQVKVKSETNKELAVAVQQFLDYHISLQMKSRTFLQQIRALYQ